jgi:hydrogenase expression/formation protein HypD
MLTRSAFRDPALAHRLADVIAREATRPLRFMEVCGTHTMAIARSGLKALLPPTVTLISGPGCPVCVTPQTQIDRFITLGRDPNVILASFGDMLRVPGSHTTLEAERAAGVDVRIVYSPLDAVIVAQEHPKKRIIFFGVGFETTAPAVALAIREAATQQVMNFAVLVAHKLIPPAMEALAADPAVALDGFLCPGHVSAVIGSAAYEPFVERYHIPCAIAGFEPLDILQALVMLVRQATADEARVEVPYQRVVPREGNPVARACVEEVFSVCDTPWRGLGVIPDSGLALRTEYASFDAERDLTPLPNEEISTACECGAILAGRQSPPECRAFASACTPERPLGPCMVSAEGACAAAYRYRPEETL